jgi:hypothetical protein
MRCEMAINEKDFTEKIDTGLKSTKNFKVFLYRFKLGNKSYRKLFDYTHLKWDKRTATSKAKSDAYNYKEDIKNGGTDTEIDIDIKLDKFAHHYFSTMNKSTSYSENKWVEEIKSYYKRYISKEIGSKKVKDIRQMHIKKIIGYINMLGLSARTQKTTIEILNPMFKSAIANRIITFNPCDGITIKRPNTKKKVQGASLLLKDVYNAIVTTFKDDMYFWFKIFIFICHVIS